MSTVVELPIITTVYFTIIVSADKIVAAERIIDCAKGLIVKASPTIVKAVMIIKNAKGNIEIAIVNFGRAK